MMGLFGIVILILDIVAIMDVFKSPASGDRKALWIILIVLLPVLGMILYFLLGKKS